MRPIAGEREQIHQHSGWLVPLAFASVILVLCGLILGWYLRPLPQGSAPTGESRIVHLSVHGVRLAVPANYIATARARSGGAQDNVSLAALLPDFQGFSPQEAQAFTGNAPDSRVIRLTLHGDTASLNARQRMDRVYRPYITDAAGTDGGFGLTQYGFAAGSGYDDSDLFAGTDSRGLELFLCERPAADIPSPNCLALDRPLGEGKEGHQASLSWRFKRAYLARWRDITGGVYGLIARFEAAG
jgi:hypothetical protein